MNDQLNLTLIFCNVNLLSSHPVLHVKLASTLTEKKMLSQQGVEISTTLGIFNINLGPLDE